MPPPSRPRAELTETAGSPAARRLSCVTIRKLAHNAGQVRPLGSNLVSGGKPPPNLPPKSNAYHLSTDGRD